MQVYRRILCTDILKAKTKVSGCVCIAQPSANRPTIRQQPATTETVRVNDRCSNPPGTHTLTNRPAGQRIAQHSFVRAMQIKLSRIDDFPGRLIRDIKFMHVHENDHRCRFSEDSLSSTRKVVASVVEVGRVVVTGCIVWYVITTLRHHQYAR